jgi:hypothetical protein
MIQDSYPMMCLRITYDILSYNTIYSCQMDNKNIAIIINFVDNYKKLLN